MSPTPGRIVLVCIGIDNPDTEYAQPALRPALVVRAWNPTCINAQLFLDGYNDDRFLGNLGPSAGNYAERHNAPLWLTSITEGEGVGQWRWPARA